MQCKQAHDYAHIKCNQSKFMSLLPLLVFFSCPRIWSISFLQCCSLFVHVPVQPLLLCLNLSQSFHILSLLIYPPCTISISRLSYLCTISPPLSSISIKGMLLIDAKVCIWGRWLRLESCIFYGHHLIVGMTPLVDTNLIPIESCTTWILCRASWDTTYRIFDLDIN